VTIHHMIEESAQLSVTSIRLARFVRAIGSCASSTSTHGRCERKQTNVEANLPPVKVNHAAGAAFPSVLSSAAAQLSQNDLVILLMSTLRAACCVLLDPLDKPNMKCRCMCLWQSSSCSERVSPRAIVYSNRRLARRPRPPDLVVHMAGLDIAVGSVLRLAECPSGCGCDMGWLAANESAAASQKLVFLARQSNHALSLSILESSRSETSRLADYAARELSASHAHSMGSDRMQRRREKVPEWLLLHVSPWLLSFHRV
jgi:hypothetical protein